MVGVAFVTAGLVDALAAVVLIVACGATVRTVVRNRDWRDNLSLWSATVAAVPDCARARFNLGQAYFERMRRTDAEREWLAAQAIEPLDADVELALATLYYQLAMHETATARVESALRLEPGDPKARTLAGWIALDSGHPERAIEHFDAALALAPGDEGASLGRERAAQALKPPAQKIMRLKQGQGPD
jgi:tetratricopeptide (TPR) repeat protein